MTNLVELSLQQAANTLPCKNDYANNSPNKLANNFAEGNSNATVLKTVGATNVLCKMSDSSENITEKDFSDLLKLSNKFVKIIKKEYGDIKELTEIDDIECVRQMFSSMANMLSMSAYTLASNYSNELSENKRKVLSAMDKKDAAFLKMKEQDDTCKALEAEQNGIIEHLNSIQREVDICLEDEINSRRKLDEIREKREKFDKWCWVPFYNIYLLVDSERAESEYSLTQEKLRQAEEKRNQLNFEREKMTERFIKSDIEHDYHKLNVILADQDAKKFSREITLLKSKSVECSNVSVYFSMIYNTLQFCGDDTVSISRLFEDLVLMLDMFSQRDALKAQSEQKLLESEKSKYFVDLIGPYGNKSDNIFADIKTIVADKKKITGIVVRAGNIVDAIQLIYADGSRGYIYGNAGGGTETVINFDSDDELFSISGETNVYYFGRSVISNIEIKTRKGKVYSNLGGYNHCGNGFCIEVPSDEKFIGISGSVCDNTAISEIGIIALKTN